MYSRFVTVLCLFFFLGLVSALPPNLAIRQAASALASPTVQTLSSTMTAQASSTASPTAAAPFVLPGTTIQVLPVGLGVYGGITAIGIFVIAFGTWQRIHCRKTFRRQRTAEDSSIIAPYGGVTKGDFSFSN